MNKLEYRVGLVMLAIFSSLCALSLWHHLTDGVVFFGMLSYVMIMGFLKHYAEEEKLRGSASKVE